MAEDLKIKITGDSKNLQNSLDEASGGVKKFNVSLAKLAKAGAIGFTAIAAGLTYAIKKAADFEVINTQFEVLTGSAAKASMAMEQLSEFSARTPFQFEDIAKASQKLLGFGFSVNELTEKMQQVGDVSAAVGAELGDVTLIFGQVAAAGKLTGERFLQLQERAIPIGPAIAKTMNVAESEVRNLISAGKVTDEVFQKAFATLSQEGGVAFGGMQKRSETLSGTISTLKDNFTLFVVEIGKKFIPVIKEISIGLTNITAYLKKAFTPPNEIEKLDEEIASLDQRIADFQSTKIKAEEGIWSQLLYGDPVAIGIKISALEDQRNEAFRRQNEFLAQQRQSKKALEESLKEEEKETQKTDFELKLERQRVEALTEQQAKQLYLAQERNLETKNNNLRLLEEQKFGKKQAAVRAFFRRSDVQNLQATFAEISTLSNANTKGLMMVGKGAAIAQATMSTFQAANMALAAPPGPPWSFGYVGAVIAAGLANVSKIVGVKLAKGGIVMPSVGGTQATIGEAGSPEAVIPLDSPQAEDFGLGAFNNKMELDINFTGDFARFIETKQVENERLRISIQRA